MKNILRIIFYLGVPGLLIYVASWKPPCCGIGRVERMRMADMVSQLTAAAAIYTDNQKKTPTNFSDFVVSSGMVTGDKTISLEGFKSYPEEHDGFVILKDEVILYSSEDYDGRYNWNDGKISCTILRDKNENRGGSC